jgi:hypothetical protein
MYKPGSESSEYFVVKIALAISACWILGLDIQPVLSLLISKEAAELVGTVPQTNPRGGWQAVAAMWGGVTIYTVVRGYIKKNAFPEGQ